MSTQRTENLRSFRTGSVKNEALGQQMDRLYVQVIKLQQLVAVLDRENQQLKEDVAALRRDYWGGERK